MLYATFVKVCVYCYGMYMHSIQCVILSHLQCAWYNAQINQKLEQAITEAINVRLYEFIRLCGKSLTIDIYSSVIYTANVSGPWGKLQPIPDDIG